MRGFSRLRRAIRGARAELERLAKVGRGAEAVTTIRRAPELDPLSLVIQSDLGLVLLLDRQYAAARNAWEEALRMDPSFVIPHYFLHRLEAIAILDGWASAHAPRWHDIAFYQTISAPPMRRSTPWKRGRAQGLP